MMRPGIAVHVLTHQEDNDEGAQIFYSDKDEDFRGEKRRHPKTAINMLD